VSESDKLCGAKQMQASGHTANEVTFLHSCHRLGGVCLAKAGLDKTGEAQGRIKEGLWIDSNILN